MCTIGAWGYDVFARFSLRIVNMRATRRPYMRKKSLVKSNLPSHVRNR